jgi:hypothetical protein
MQRLAIARDKTAFTDEKKNDRGLTGRSVIGRGEDGKQGQG